MTHNESRKPETVIRSRIPVTNGNTRVNSEAKVVARGLSMGCGSGKGMVVVLPDWGGGVAIEYHHQTCNEKC